MQENKQARMMNNFHIYGVKSRVMTQETAQSHKQPSYGELLCLSLDDILPSRDDQRKLLENYCVLFARVICEHIPFFKKFADCVPSHIIHPYSKEMSQKSEVVSINHQHTAQKMEPSICPKVENSHVMFYVHVHCKLILNLPCYI